MWAIFKKEINSFFSSLTGYVVIGIFLLLLGMIMWVFPEYSVLEYNYATLDQLFTIGPLIFLFLIPAICMRSFSEERFTGTIEILLTKPLKIWSIVLGKYAGVIFLILVALLPTLLYYYSIWTLGSPQGNIDSGEVIGSYIGLVFLGGSFAAIGIFASVLTTNQIISFLLGAVLCFLFYWGFSFISSLPVFYGGADHIIQQIGIDYHYQSLSKGVLDTRALVYFISIIFFFLFLSHKSIVRNNF
jgi:ABC-2 type transport system permease protein